MSNQTVGVNLNVKPQLEKNILAIKFYCGFPICALKISFTRGFPLSEKREESTVWILTHLTRMTQIS